MEEFDQFMVMTGNPIDGFSFVGPFDDHEDATEYAERNMTCVWWIVKLDKPEAI